MPLSHFQKEERDRAGEHYQHPDLSAAMDAYLKQFK
jgi:hypothetical protein